MKKELVRTELSYMRPSITTTTTTTTETIKQIQQ